jgi:two-component system LytT family response regulator
MKRYQCLIVEDEPLAQQLIENYLARYNQFDVVRTCENVLQAYEILNQQKIDVIFLDINLPVIKGIEFIKSLKEHPAVIFTTAYSEYAANSYELDAVDYLVKPFSFERFSKAISKLLRMQPLQDVHPEKDFIFIKVGGKLKKINFSDILYIEARKDYLMVNLVSESHLTRMTIKSINKILPADLFIQVHRSFIIKRSAVSGITNNSIEIDGKIIPVGEKFKANILHGFNNC